MPAFPRKEVMLDLLSFLHVSAPWGAVDPERCQRWLSTWLILLVPRAYCFRANRTQCENTVPSPISSPENDLVSSDHISRREII